MYMHHFIYYLCIEYVYNRQQLETLETYQVLVGILPNIYFYSLYISSDVYVCMCIVYMYICVVCYSAYCSTSVLQSVSCVSTVWNTPA